MAPPRPTQTTLVPPPGAQTPRITSTRPYANPYTPPIPEPTTDTKNLAACVAALKICSESLTGQRGDASNRAVTFNDLMDYGILDPAAVRSPQGGFVGGGGTGGAGGGTITGVFSGLGLVGGGTTGNVTLSLLSPVAIATGGTGATSAAAALANLGGAPLASPLFTGDPRAPTPATSDNDTSLATTAYVKAQGYQTGNQTITLTGDTTGSGTTAIGTTLATVNANLGTFNNITINAKGLATAGSNVAYLTGNQTITHTGDVTGSGTTTIPMTLATVNANVGTFQGLTVNAKGLVTAASNQSYLTGNQTITLTGDTTGSGTTSIPVTLATVNANVGSFTNASITVNAKGLITAASTGAGGGGSLSGMTAGQIPIAATATTVTSSANLSGDLTSNATLVTTLATVNANVGTFQGLTVNAKGLVTAAVNQNYVTGGPYLPIAGGTLTGKLITIASATGGSGFNAPHGAAPTAPVDGDIWTTTAGLFARVNGATVGPYGTGGSTGLSGMTAGRIPIAATATTITSSANLSGDITSNATLVTTLATVNGNVGTFQGLTVNAKGLVTAAVNQSYVTGGPYLPLTGGTLTSPGNLTLPGIEVFSSAGTSPPTFTTRSIGTRIVLWNFLGATSVDYALGMDGSTMWFSIPNAVVGQVFRWYGGQTSVMSLDGTGNLTIVGAYLRFAGTTANVNAAGGPLIYADNATMVFKAAGANGWWLQNSAGNNIVTCDAIGNFGVGGSSASIGFTDRSGTGSWLWYSTGQTARLFNGADRVSVDAAGVLTVNNPIITTGSNAFLQFANRDSAGLWGWYSSASIARLWWSGNGDRATVDTGGSAMFLGNGNFGSGYGEGDAAGAAITSYGPIYARGKFAGGGQIRMSNNAGYGSMWYNDGGSTYLLLTNNGDWFGSYNGLRPFIVDMATGNVSMGHQVAVGGPFIANSTITATGSIICSSGSVSSFAANLQAVGIYASGVWPGLSYSLISQNDAEMRSSLYVRGGLQVSNPATFGSNITCQGSFYRPGASNPVNLYCDPGYNAYVFYNSYTARNWSLGCRSDGLFILNDETAATWRMYFSSGYNTYFNCHHLPASDNFFYLGIVGNAYNAVYAYAYPGPSSRALKRDIANPLKGALDQVKSIRPVQFHWKDTETEDMPLHRGFIADEVREVMGDRFAGYRKHAKRMGSMGEPGVDVEIPETETLEYNELMVVLWQAVQELSAEVDALKAQRS